MKKQAFNPYLPSYEFVPDVEPYVFGDRVYVYGSHDRADGADFCLNDYVCWSAPVEDLSDWRYEGVIYRRDQDPLNKDMKQYLYAPDMAQGPDGRYYLFYALHMLTVISVAVCDTPCGKFEFLGHVHLPDGTVYGTRPGDVNNFDPGVLVDDDGKVYLYVGFSPEKGFMRTMMQMRKRNLDGGFVMELEQDMVTMKSEPKLIIPGPLEAPGTDFDGHAFFEASSMRKVNGTYYFIYSSVLSHELCYATSDHPTGGFRFGGTLVSIGDVGLEGRSPEEAVNYTGNTHGSIVEINGTWYVFYHRQTNQKKCCRQGCAEEIRFLPDGSISQAEITSCGLNGGPLEGNGTYEARIACNLWSREGTFPYEGNKIKDKKKIHPYFTQTGPDREENGNQYIANLADGATAGFKYFDLQDLRGISVKVRGEGAGVMEVRERPDGAPLTQIAVEPSADWREFSSACAAEPGVKALYFTFRGKGAVDFAAFTLE